MKAASGYCKSRLFELCQNEFDIFCPLMEEAEEVIIILQYTETLLLEFIKLSFTVNRPMYYFYLFANCCL